MVRGKLVFVGVSVVALATVVVFASGTAGSAGDGMYRLVGVFGQVLALVRSSYVEEVAVDRLETGAVAGLVERADPGGMWVPNESQATVQAVLRREVPPFGLVLGKRSSYPFVLEVLPGSPAAEAGVQPGELIERVGDEPVRARPLWVSQVLLDQAERAGSSVVLDVIDRGLQGKRPVLLQARPVLNPPPELRLEEGVPVLRLWRLDDVTLSLLKVQLATLESSPGVVVDLRGVALGSPEAAVKVAAEVVGGEVELTAARRHGKGDVVRARGESRSWKVVVCVDATTAGAGEVAALAFQSRGAVLVGLETFGDTGRRQSIRSSGGHLWLAESWFAAPDGTAILGSGIQPDEVVRLRRDRDTILQRALELAGAEAAAEAA